MESMGAFFSGKAVWYGGTGTGAQITGNPTGGSGSGSSFVPGTTRTGSISTWRSWAIPPKHESLTSEYHG